MMDPNSRGGETVSITEKKKNKFTSNRITMPVLNEGFFQMKSICLQGNCNIGSFLNEYLKMTADYNGYWKMISNENFEEYLKALGEFCGSFTPLQS